LFLRNKDARDDADAQHGLIWFLAIFGFLSCMSFKRADYLLPAYPGMAIFLGSTIARWWQTRCSCAGASGAVRWGFAPGIVVLGIYLIGWTTYNGLAADGAQSYRAMAEEIRRQTRGPVVFFRAES